MNKMSGEDWVTSYTRYDQRNQKGKIPSCGTQGSSGSAKQAGRSSSSARGVEGTQGGGTGTQRGSTGVEGGFGGGGRERGRSGVAVIDSGLGICFAQCFSKYWLWTRESVRGNCINAKFLVHGLFFDTPLQRPPSHTNATKMPDEDWVTSYTRYDPRNQKGKIPSSATQGSSGSAKQAGRSSSSARGVEGTQGGGTRTQRGSTGAEGGFGGGGGRERGGSGVAAIDSGPCICFAQCFSKYWLWTRESVRGKCINAKFLVHGLFFDTPLQRPSSHKNATKLYEDWVTSCTRYGRRNKQGKIPTSGTQESIGSKKVEGSSSSARGARGDSTGAGAPPTAGGPDICFAQCFLNHEYGPEDQ